MNKYILRHAAGRCWAVDIGQTGNPYKPPLQLNETGEEIFRLSLEGLSADAIAKKIADRESLPYEEIRKDVGAFLEDLQRNGYCFTD